MGVVYKHALNGKSYIGYTKYSMDERLKQHANRKTKNSHFGNAIRKYGKENIISDILFECDDLNKLKEMESLKRIRGCAVNIRRVRNIRKSYQNR